MSQLVGPGGMASAGATSVIFTSTGPHRPGETRRDTDGNEFMFVDFTATTYYGCLVQIDSMNKAAPLLGTANRPFRVGVVCGGTASSVDGQHPTSDSSGWVQIYGIHSAVQTEVVSDGGVSATAGGAYLCIPQTAVATPSGVLGLVARGTVPTSTANTSTEGNVIFGMWVVDLGEVSDLTTWPGTSAASGPSSNNESNGATSGPATSGFVGQTYAVFLNYPYVTGVAQALVNAVSDF